MFGEIAHRYDFMNHLLSGGVDHYWRWRTVRAVPPRGEAPILDICTGTGDLAFAYWKKGRGRTPVVGADFTHEMLTHARRKLSARSSPSSGEPSIAFLEADAQRLPFEDEEFQIVCVAFGLRNVADTRAGLLEMVRVCRRGGRVAVLEFSTPRNRIFGGVYRWYFRHVLPRIGQLLARNRESAYRYLPESVEEFPEGGELTALMEDCGLTETSFRRLKC